MNRGFGEPEGIQNTQMTISYQHDPYCLSETVYLPFYKITLGLYRTTNLHCACLSSTLDSKIIPYRTCIGLRRNIQHSELLNISCQALEQSPGRLVQGNRNVYVSYKNENVAK